MTYEEYQLKVIAYIREKRKEKGITQRQIAKMMGCTHITYNAFEMGRGTTSMRFMYEVCDCLGLEFRIALKEKNITLKHGKN